MRAVVYLWFNLLCLYLVHRFGLWKQMFGDSIIFAWWLWIIFGAIWAGNAQLKDRARMRETPAEREILRKVAEAAEERDKTFKNQGPV